MEFFYLNTIYLHNLNIFIVDKRHLGNIREHI